MAQKFDRVLSIIQAYLKRLRQGGFRISKAYLYGSFANGHPQEFSDIDIGLVSNDFTGDWFDDRRRIIPVRRHIDERLEPMPYRPEDFHAGSPLAAEIMAHGIELNLDEIESVEM